jgi:DNA-binding transcriptional LysR family regulator
MSLRLPPLSTLRLFEAAGRLQSFKLAAAELNVTPSAVSHGIVSLESYLGVALFVRQPRRLVLTPEGADYLTYVSEAFGLLAAGMQRLQPCGGPARISLTCAPTLASRWLLPRLPAFRRLWPQVDISLDTSPRHVGFPADGFDFAIRMSRTPAGGPAWTRLFGEALIPVCSPAYLERLAGSDGHVELKQATLLHVVSAGEDWQAWVDATAAPDMDLSAGMRFDTIQLAVEAAVAGLGVVLGRLPLIGAELSAGTLVAASPHRVPAQTAYWLISAEDVARRPALAAFRQWLLDEAIACAGEPDAAVQGTGQPGTLLAGAPAPFR